MSKNGKSLRGEYEEVLDSVCRTHPSTMVLYWKYLVKCADDEGFVSSISIALSNHFSIEDVNVLEGAGLLITPDPCTGVSVLVYWNLLSTVKPCRRKETAHQYEKSFLVVSHRKWCVKNEQETEQKFVQKMVHKNGAELHQNSGSSNSTVFYHHSSDGLSGEKNEQKTTEKGKESGPSPLSPSPSSPTPLTTTPPIIPQPTKEKENPPITPKGVVRDCENAKKTDRNIASASSMFAPRNGEHPSKSRQDFLKLSQQEQIWFEQFWTAYPKKADAPCAIRAWKKARVTDALFDRIMKSIDEHKRYCDTWERGFYKNPATWLNECCWETEFGNKGNTSSSQTKKTLEQIAAEQAAYQREIELSERMAPKFI